MMTYEDAADDDDRAIKLEITLSGQSCSSVCDDDDSNFSMSTHKGAHTHAH